MLPPKKKNVSGDESLDVSKMLGDYNESDPIKVEPLPPTPAAPTTAPTVSVPVSKPTTSSGYKERPLEERLKEDLKISYNAKGILDITFGGYGFLRQDYVIDPNKDIYVSTSQIRRFWLRRGVLRSGGVYQI